jgi:anti-sigma B factor antagonist
MTISRSWHCTDPTHREVVMAEPGDACTLAEFELNSELGNERLAMARIAQIAIGLAIPAARREQLEYAVGEAVRNAIEHGNALNAEAPVRVSVVSVPGTLVIRVADRGVGGAAIGGEAPDLDAKLAGLQSSRGWGLFLIEHMVDEFRVVQSELGHTAELVLHLRAHEQDPLCTVEGSENAMIASKVTMKARAASRETAVIDISGEVNAFAEDELMAAYTEASTGGARTIVLNFTDVGYINSSGIGLLVTLLIRTNRNGHRLFAYGLGQHYKRIFELTRLNEAIRVFEDEETALDAAAST